jgi:hypothetical protein
MADIQGHGTVLLYGDSTSPTSPIAVITNISGPNETADSVEMTDFDSDAAVFEQGLKDPGEMSLDLKYHKTHSATLRTIEERSDTTNTPYVFRVRFNDNTATASQSWWQCRGFITSLGHAIPNDGIVTQSVSIKFSGASTASFDA